MVNMLLFAARTLLQGLALYSPTLSHKSWSVRTLLQGSKQQGVAPYSPTLSHKVGLFLVVGTAARDHRMTGQQSEKTCSPLSVQHMISPCWLTIRRSTATRHMNICSRAPSARSATLQLDHSLRGRFLEDGAPRQRRAGSNRLVFLKTHLAA